MKRWHQIKVPNDVHNDQYKYYVLLDEHHLNYAEYSILPSGELSDIRNWASSKNIHYLADDWIVELVSPKIDKMLRLKTIK